MKISFVIPAYNESSVIGQCLDAVVRAVATTSVETEIIVVNNASTDDTARIAASYPGVHVVDQPRKGLVWARHAGFIASTGDIVANIDADTIMPKEWLPYVIQRFQSDPSLLALSGPYYYYDASWIIRASTYLFYAMGLLGDKISQIFFKKGSMLQGGNFVLRRSALEQIGGFDTSIEFYGEDTDVGKRLNKVGKVVWTFKLPMYSSGRRLMKEGVILTAINYGINFFWINIFGKPYTKKYNDVRPDGIRKNN